MSASNFVSIKQYTQLTQYISSKFIYSIFLAHLFFILPLFNFIVCLYIFFFASYSIVRQADYVCWGNELKDSFDWINSFRTHYDFLKKRERSEVVTQNVPFPTSSLTCGCAIVGKFYTSIEININFRLKMIIQ